MSTDYRDDVWPDPVQGVVVEFADARLLAAQQGADVDGSARVRNDAERPVSAH